MAIVLLSTCQRATDQPIHTIGISGPLKAVVDFYELRGGFSAFFNDLKNKGIPQKILALFFDLIRKLATTITQIAESKAIYRTILQKDGKVRCVWSGDTITRYDIDHIIPFTIWKNNDLWNLLPARPDLNNQKRDKVPNPELIEGRRELIKHYWDLISRNKFQRFQKELQITLLGLDKSEDWHDRAINQLKKSCDYLISTRGFEMWSHL